MKTTFIFLACLMVITVDGKYDDLADRKKQCNNKAEEIYSQDCKQQCDEAESRRVCSECLIGRECAECIMEHKDYDSDCKNYSMLRRCNDILTRIFREDCIEECGKLGVIDHMN